MYCERCGKYSGKYPLCKNCYYDDDLSEEELEDDLDEFDEDYDEEYLEYKETCPICGNPSFLVYGKYPRKDKLCKECSQKVFKKEIEQCPDCHKWFQVGETCTCKRTQEAAEEKQAEQVNQEIIQTIIIEKGIRCITCGYETDGKFFCKRCYSKYHNKEILIKIKNCREIVPLDDFYEGYFECDDGHVVKSMAEREIDNYLFANNIKHGYEIALLLTDETGKRITLHPDFCIFDEHSKPLYYIEYWGFDESNRDYTKTKKFKIPLYEKAGITLININAKTDLRNLKSNLKFKLENFIPGIINFLKD